MSRLTTLSPRSVLRRPRLITRRRVRAALGLYMRFWHRMEIEGLNHLPPSGPALILGNHSSFLDVPAIIVASPYPNAAMLTLASMLRKPLVGQALRAYDAIPVKREGRDMASISALREALRRGKVVMVAVEGARSRDGRLGPIHPVLASIAAGSGVPIIPVGIAGSFAAMPWGTFFPRPHKIVVRFGEPFTLAAETDRAEAATCIAAAIAALLPAEQQPLSGSGMP